MRPLIHGRQLPLEYWAEAALTAAYLRNRSPSAAIGGITPYELWHGTVPDLSHLRVFGCLAFSMLSDKAREHSLSVRSKVGVFVGYDKVQKGYRIHFPDTGELVVTRNVGFHEDKAYDFSTLPQSPEPTADIPNTTTDTAARPPGVRPRLVVIGPRRPADVLPPAEVEIDAFDTVPASVGAPPLSSAAAPPPVSPSPVPAVGAPSAPSASAAGPRPSESAPAAAPASAHGRPRPRPKPASAYIRSMLERFNMKDLTPIDSPLDPKQRLVPFEGEASAERIQMFQATIGCLNWLAQASRPDIAYAVATLARHCKNPGPIHFGVVKRVMRYLVATADYKFRIAAHSINDVTAYSDADFGGDFSAKSTSGYSVSVHGATVAWGAKLQSLVADSTAQAELIAVWQTTREHQERGIIDVKYVNTKANPADMFTKGLPAATFAQHREAIGLHPH
ncbi:unnamed protein product [Tilletia caries]|uniref:Retroviral polymerase SH3-like domain-containing protein n=1 Tax=Tilletia caries TaxID=13290 RepID=A0ABN7IWI3_9BASI|nr:unnamed protein product [Tilletia caries]